MKLYEFTITDNNKRSAQELDQLMQNVLKTESHQQGWMPGFQCSPVGIASSLDDGSKQYHFQVTGSFQSANSPDEEAQSSDAISASEPIAARPLDL
jgi:hypothetical protein